MNEIKESKTPTAQTPPPQLLDELPNNNDPAFLFLLVEKFV